MTIETDALRAEIRAWLDGSLLSIPDYSADPIALRRVGQVLAEASARVSISPFGPNW